MDAKSAAPLRNTPGLISALSVLRQQKPSRHASDNREQRKSSLPEMTSSNASRLLSGLLRYGSNYTNGQEDHA